MKMSKEDRNKVIFTMCDFTYKIILLSLLLRAVYPSKYAHLGEDDYLILIVGSFVVVLVMGYEFFSKIKEMENKYAIS